LLSPVNPQTDAKRWDPITDAILWLDYDQNRADLLLMKLVEQECADEVIGRSTYFRVMAPWRHANRLRNCPPLGGKNRKWPTVKTARLTLLRHQPRCPSFLQTLDTIALAAVISGRSFG
jgi:hypothetical protein